MGSCGIVPLPGFCPHRTRTRQPGRDRVQVAGDLVTELDEVRVSMVAGHVGVKVLPEPLDAIVVGAVGRQEVQPDAG